MSDEISTVRIVDVGRAIPLVKGAWSAETAYEMLDIVSYNGYTYIAKANTEPGILPTDTEHWMLVAGSITNWGDIYGQIENQGDLRDALDAKLNAADAGTMAAVDDAPNNGSPYLRKGEEWYNADDRYYTETEMNTKLNAKANLASPTFTGTPKAPTAAAGTNTTQLATTAFVQSGLSGKSDTGHTHDDRYYTETEMDTKLAAKADLASPTFTGTPAAPTAAKGTNTTQIATTAFVAAGLADKQNTLTFDDAPTANSANPVKSGGIKTALDEKSGHVSATVSGSIVTIDDGVDAPIADMTVAIEPVQAGSGDPSPDNVRPITGWTGVNVTRTGKNLYNIADTIGSDNAVVTITGNSLHVVADASKGYQSAYVQARKMIYKSGRTYYVKFKVTQNSTYVNGYTRFAFRSINSHLIAPARSIIMRSGVYEYSGTITLDIDCYACFLMNNGTGSENMADTTFYDIMISEVDAPFEPYNGAVYSVSFEDAGTVYGGSLDVSTGKLVVDKVKISITGTENFFKNTENQFYFPFQSGNTFPLPKINIPKSATNISDAISNWYTVSSQANCTVGSNHIAFSAWDTRTFAYFAAQSADQTVDQFKQILQTAYTGGSPLEVCYELEAPLTYQLSPQQVRTVLGKNNIWADTGDSTVTYFTAAGQSIGTAITGPKATAEYLDTKTRSMITSNLEATTTASKSYSAGNLIIVGDKLLRATTGIGIGGTITVGTNAEVVTLETLLSELSA